MKEIKLRLDWYTKFILTVIAFSFLGLLFKPLFIPLEAKASKEIVNVNIERIGGSRIDSLLPPPIKVKVVE